MQTYGEWIARVAELIGTVEFEGELVAATVDNVEDCLGHEPIIAYAVTRETLAAVDSTAT